MTAHSTPGGGAIGTAPELEDMPPTDPAETLAELLHLWCVSDDLPIPDLAAEPPSPGAESGAGSDGETAWVANHLGPEARHRYRALAAAGRLTQKRKAQVALLVNALPQGL